MKLATVIKTVLVGQAINISALKFGRLRGLSVVIPGTAVVGPS